MYQQDFGTQHVEVVSSANAGMMNRWEPFNRGLAHLSFEFCGQGNSAQWPHHGA